MSEDLRKSKEIIDSEVPAELLNSPRLATEKILAGVKLAGFWIRFLAAVIDALLFSLINMPFNYLIGLVLKNQIGVGYVTFISFIFSISLTIIYYGWFYRNKGGTPGKLLLGLRVIDLRTGENLEYSQTALRELVGKMFSGLIFTIGYIMAGVRADKKALHDLIAHTQVIIK